MRDFEVDKYGPTFAELLAVDRCRPLDEGEPDEAMYGRLSKLTADSAFEHASVSDPGMAAACLSGVWLLYDYLDDSHRISQSIPTATGSFWHGIMHRREGDFSNAKYWFRSVGHHEIYDALASRADKLSAEHGAAGVLPGGHWDPMAFVDACQAAVRGNSDQESFCRAVQQAEWELLFDYCYRQAVA